MKKLKNKTNGITSKRYYFRCKFCNKKQIRVVGAFQTKLNCKFCHKEIGIN